MTDDLRRRLEEKLSAKGKAANLTEVVRRGQKLKTRNRLSTIGSVALIGVTVWAVSGPLQGSIGDGRISPAPPVASGEGQERKRFPIFGATDEIRVDAVLHVVGRSICLEGVYSGARAAHLHQIDAAQSDPVAISFYEPPQEVGGGSSCQAYSDPSDEMPDVVAHPEDYYVDFHPDAVERHALRIPLIGPDREPPSDTRGCPKGIEGRGLYKAEALPPRPYFESFNLWRTVIHPELRCLTIVAGQQIRHQSEGDNDPVVYEPNGWLFIFGDYRHHRDGIAKIEVPLPRPVRVLMFAGKGYDAILQLQSLRDCSTIQYDVGEGTFGPDAFKYLIPCPGHRDRGDG